MFVHMSAGTRCGHFDEVLFEHELMTGLAEAVSIAVISTHHTEYSIDWAGLSVLLRIPDRSIGAGIQPEQYIYIYTDKLPVTRLLLPGDMFELLPRERQVNIQVLL